MYALYHYARRQSSVTQIGSTPLGGLHPIRVQSMTNTATLDTDACVAQARRIIDAGGAYVRLTAQGVREAENLALIHAALHDQGYTTPLVADIHFNPRAADAAALYVEKVRINPGNYVDSARTFKQIDYTDASYAEELQKIRARFLPFLALCREHHTAIRIGVNHGSLSDRILSRYGNTPAGMVESCMEFLRLCVEAQFSDVVLSIKSSNTVMMVKTVRLLVHTMEQEGMSFPLHLGVTEAGDGEDGRIKSAIGIGALLGDGLGDTLRVSLSEAPELEIPVAQKLVNYVIGRANHAPITGPKEVSYHPFDDVPRPTHAVGNIGGGQAPIVIADGTSFDAQQLLPDYRFLGLDDEPTSAQDIVEAHHPTTIAAASRCYSMQQLDLLQADNRPLKWLRLTLTELQAALADAQHALHHILANDRAIVLIAQIDNTNIPAACRAFALTLQAASITHPLVFQHRYAQDDAEALQVMIGADTGANLMDGLLNGLHLSNSGSIDAQTLCQWTFGALQAARCRTTKTEYISCPGCGRTLFNLERTIARVKAATSHLTGLKIGIMGCIVNGPGEMADADYGYVGAARERVSLYKGKECIEKNIPEDEAVDKLIQLIKDHGDWQEPR